MKRLLVLWDPQNPQVNVTDIVQLLGQLVELRQLTFQDVSQRTNPNGSFALMPYIDQWDPDGVLWIEGGPFPRDLDCYSCTTACWLLNSHLEPSLTTDFGSQFDHRFVTQLLSTGDESALWLPQCARNEELQLNRRISVFTADPKPPSHIATQRQLQAILNLLPTPTHPIAVCLGQNGILHDDTLTYMRFGNPVVVDSRCDLRGIAFPQDHILVYDDLKELPDYLKNVCDDTDLLDHVVERAPQLVEHLHTPPLRAERIFESFWPRHKVLCGENFKPQVSVLVSCFKYRKRFEICLESLARQELPAGFLEVVVVDPESPDDLLSYLEQVACKYQHLRLVHLPINPRYHRNRGMCINRAFDVSKGQVIISIDGDIVFPPHLIGKLAQLVQDHPDNAFGVPRVFLNEPVTQSILNRDLNLYTQWDSLRDTSFDEQESGHVGILGYCQVVQRSAFAKARYPEEFDKVNQSDIEFMNRLRIYAGVTGKFLEEEEVMHLWHPRDWTGAKVLL